MSKEFIEKRLNSSSIALAARQQEQISYLTNSKIQENRLDDNYLQQWAERKYQSNDYFLNWVKSIFKTENFLSFYKYLRYPLPSAKIIKNKIEPQLRRVFNAEDSYYKYEVDGKQEADFIGSLNIKDFSEHIFRSILYNFNSLVVSDLKDGKAYRYILDIDKVISIQEHNGVIERIAFTGSAVFEDKEHKGYIYIDSEKYALYDDTYKEITSSNHDLGHCPVAFILNTPFHNDYIVKESLFSYIRPDLEEYNFLKTLLRMTEVNGAFPVVSKLDTEPIDDDSDKDGQALEPNSSDAMASNRATLFNQNTQSIGDLQPGTVHNVPAEDITDDNGNINMDIVKSYLNFYHIPVAILDYIKGRVKEIENDIVSSIVGDVVESSEESKNELQISKSISVLENILNALSTQINRIRKLSDTDQLGLMFGIDKVRRVSIHTGTDFFLETQEQLSKEFELSANSLERKNVLVRMNQNRYKNNIDTQTRNALLYDIIPYVSDKDFEYAKDSISPELFELQTRFNYWISQFEALYGDIVVFYQDLDIMPAEKLALINNLIIQIIKQNEQKSDLVKDS